jgi:predicted transcriptional regulator
MYKNVEILDKEKFKDIKYDEADSLEVAKNIGLIPLGFTEVWSMSHSSPIIISAGDEAEFLAFTGITKEITVFNRDDVYLPAFVRTYPFLNIQVKDQDDKSNSIIAIDNNPDFVSQEKENSIITEDKNLTEEADSKVRLVRELNRQREVSKKIISELKEHDLLVKKDLRVNVTEKDEKILLDEFYVIDINKLTKLDDEVLATWARKGWMGIFDSHLKSLANFTKVLESNK